MADRFTRENPIGRLEPIDRDIVVLRTSLVDDATPDVGPGPSDGTTYEENTPVPASPNVQLAAVATPAAARIPSQNTDFRNAYSPCGDGGNMGAVFSDAKETNNNSEATVTFGHDDKYSTLHWNEDIEEYFWGAEGTNNCYIGKHLGNGSGADLTIGKCNVGVGVNSGFLLKAAENNVWVGFESLPYATTPVYSVAIGYQAGYYMDDGRGNTFVGALTGYNTSDVTRVATTREAPVWSRLKEFVDTGSPPGQPLTEYNGLMVTFRRENASSKTEVYTSPDGTNWTLRDTGLMNNGATQNFAFSSSAHFAGKAWYNIYAPTDPGQGWFATWNGVGLAEAMLYEDYYPLNPNNYYCCSMTVYQGMLVGIFTMTTSISDDRRSSYWTVNGTTWTKVTYYGDTSTTYYSYGSVYEPDSSYNFLTKANILIEHSGDLYWICSRYESSYWHTKVLKLTSLAMWSIVADIVPDSNYMHPFSAEIIGDTCYLFIQELASNGSYSTTNRSVYIYTSQDMVNWTKAKDLGDIGAISDTIWFEREFLVARVSTAVADIGVCYVDRINPITFERTSETSISTNTVVGSHAFFLAYNGELYLGKNNEVHKRTRTTWYTEELGYDLASSYNTFVGIGSGYSNIYGQGNVALGAFADFTGDSLFNATAIGYRATVSSSNTIALGGTGDYAVSVGIGKTTCGYTLDVAGTGGFSGQVTITEATLSPLSVSSAVVCTNLNADLWDGIHKTSLLGLDALTDPGGDRILFWDDSETALKWLACGNSIAITTATLDAIQDIRTTAGPSFDHLHLTIATGTAPMVVASTTMVSNLNADLLDGLHYTSFPQLVISATEAPTVNDDIDNYREGCIWIEQDVNKCYICVDNADGAAVWQEVGASGASAFLNLTDVDEADYVGHAGDYVVVNGTADGLAFSAAAVAAHDLASASHSDVDATGLSDDDILRYDSASGEWKCEALPAAANHDVLDGSVHGDTLAGAVSRGSIIYGNSTPKWAELVKGNAGDVLTCDGTDVAWAAPSAGAAHDILSATHGDALAAAVSRGSIIYGNATPKWAELTIGAADTVLRSDGTDVAWVSCLDIFGPKIVGRYYCGNFGSSSLTTAAFAANYMRAVPFYLSKTTTFDRIGLGITAGHSAGRYLRLGIYANKTDGTLYPGALVLDSGEIEITSSIFWEVNINQTLQPGIYWLAMLNSYQYTIRLASTSGCPISYGIGAPDGATGQDGYITVSLAYGALPNPFTAGASPSSAGDYFPNIVLRAA